LNPCRVLCMSTAAHVAGVPMDDGTQGCIHCGDVLLDLSKKTPRPDPRNPIFWMCPGDRVTVIGSKIRYECPHKGVIEEDNLP
jgi:hypothetical protein